MMSLGGEPVRSVICREAIPVSQRGLSAVCVGMALLLVTPEVDYVSEINRDFRSEPEFPKRGCMCAEDIFRPEREQKLFLQHFTAQARGQSLTQCWMQPII